MIRSQKPRRARIVRIDATRNAIVVAQLVRCFDNRSEFYLRGADIVDGARVGDVVDVFTVSGGTAHRATEGAWR